MIRSLCSRICLSSLSSSSQFSRCGSIAATYSDSCTSVNLYIIHVPWRLCSTSPASSRTFMCLETVDWARCRNSCMLQTQSSLSCKSFNTLTLLGSDRAFMTRIKCFIYSPNACIRISPYCDILMQGILMSIKFLKIVSFKTW